MATRFRTLLIGRTGRGNYGHNFDTAFKTHPRIELVAVADDAGKAGAHKHYTDWREALAKEKPEIVALAMRWVDCHEEMATAAADAGAHVFMEKPMGRTLAECDRMIAACERAHRRMVVAHNMRTCPILDYAQKRIGEGLIGELLEMRARGKEDRRAGGEDLMVLGTHMFDLMRRFGGDATWAFGSVRVSGKPVRRIDVNTNAPEGLGATGGDTIEGMFGFSAAITGYFASRKSSDVTGTRWGLDLLGTKGTARIRPGHVPQIWIGANEPEKDPSWRRLEIPTGIGPASEPAANHLLIDDLIGAIENRREPQASGVIAMRAIEMAHALYASERTGAKVSLPLATRDNPLLS